MTIVNSIFLSSFFPLLFIAFTSLAICVYSYVFACLLHAHRHNHTYILLCQNSSSTITRSTLANRIAAKITPKVHCWLNFFWDILFYLSNFKLEIHLKLEQPHAGLSGRACAHAYAHTHMYTCTHSAWILHLLEFCHIGCQHRRGTCLRFLAAPNCTETGMLVSSLRELCFSPRSRDCLPLSSGLAECGQLDMPLTCLWNAKPVPENCLPLTGLWLCLLHKKPRMCWLVKS